MATFYIKSCQKAPKLPKTEKKETKTLIITLVGKKFESPLGRHCVWDPHPLFYPNITFIYYFYAIITQKQAGAG